VTRSEVGTDVIVCLYHEVKVKVKVKLKLKLKLEPYPAFL
jgi:hypothetical protein